MSGIRDPWRSIVIIVVMTGFGISPAYHWGWGVAGAIIMAVSFLVGVFVAVLARHLDARDRARRAAAAAPALGPAQNRNAPGWYADPDDPAKTRMRYWNGSTWADLPPTQPP